MHIKQIELYGFKSFVDKTVISLSPGICAVVGPNGCGKSNIVDAIRWVLGEQSAKQLRGKVMEEVIFSGANGRPSLNFAEVSLVLANDQGTLPPPYSDCSEVMVTRRLFRSGESEYLINKIPCRRLDITRLFMDSGIGHHHYAIIEQGRISYVVESKPEDIRSLIEEAAGITKFKVKKKAALRKIELTRQNLVRLGDIIGEVSRQISSLKRQAQRASRYRALKQEIKKLEVSRAAYYYASWQGELSRLLQARKQIEDAQARRAAILGRLDAELTQRSTQAEELEAEMRRRRELLYELKSAVSTDEQWLGHAATRLHDLRGQTERLQAEITELTQRQQELDREHQQLETDRKEAERQLAAAAARLDSAAGCLQGEKDRLGELTDEIDYLKGELVDTLGEIARARNQEAAAGKRRREMAAIQQRCRKQSGEIQRLLGRCRPQIASLQEKLDEINRMASGLDAEEKALSQKVAQLEEKRRLTSERLRRLEGDLHRLRSKLEALEEMEKSYGWFGEPVRVLLQARDRQQFAGRLQGVVADLLEVDERYHQAVAAALGEGLQAIILASGRDAAAAIEHLRQTATGRSHFVALDMLTSRRSPELPGDAPTPLASLVRPRPGYEPVVTFLLADVFLVDSLEAALTWWQAHPHTCTLVTPAGEVVRRDGLICGGVQEPQANILEKRAERQRLQERLAAIDQEITNERQQLAEIENSRQKAAARIDAIAAEQRKLHEDALQTEKALLRLQAEEQSLTDRLRLLALEQKNAEEQGREAREEQHRWQQELQRLEETEVELRQQVASTESQRRQTQEVVAALQEDYTKEQIAVSTLQQRLEASKTNIQRVGHYRRQGEQRLRQLQAELTAGHQQYRQLQQRVEETKERLEQNQQRFNVQEEAVKAAERRWLEFEARHHELEAERAALLKEDKAQQQQSQQLHQEATELNLKLEYLRHQIQERYRIDIAAGHETQVPSSSDLERIEPKIERLRDRVARIGEVNLTAIEEYEQQKQRYDFLVTQRDDLNKSLDGLRQAISRINRTTRSRFLKTLEKVNHKLAEVFLLLFGGGSARLQLVDPANPLESGVEIMVHPPGKRLTSMSLLSGGEKALAAVALLFSLYMIRRSPFCILDEVDSPLDEANVDRFNQVLRGLSRESQIIMVTHNKRTMEISDLLLGVTMEEAGVSKIISVNLKGGPTVDAHLA